jgi:hypothetical protein
LENDASASEEKLLGNLGDRLRELKEPQESWSHNEMGKATKKDLW